MHSSRGSPLYPLSELRSDTSLRDSAPKNPIRTGSCAYKRCSCTCIINYRQGTFIHYGRRKSADMTQSSFIGLSLRFTFLQLCPKNTVMKIIRILHCIVSQKMKGKKTPSDGHRSLGIAIYIFRQRFR